MGVNVEAESGSRRRAWRDIVIYGACGGVLITVLKLTEYRFLVIEHSVEIYGALIAALFAAYIESPISMLAVASVPPYGYCDRYVHAGTRAEDTLGVIRIRSLLESGSASRSSVTVRST